MRQILPLAMATASTMESFAFTVRILPLIKIRSGVCAEPFLPRRRAVSLPCREMNAIERPYKPS